MPLLRAVPVMLSAGERTALNKRVRGAKTAHRDRLRAQIVLAAARGQDNARIAADLRITVDTVRKWRGRFAGRGLDGLADLPRSGRPRRISELTRAAVVALACQLPAATGVPLSRWTGPELLAEITRAGLAGQLSVSSVLRTLAEHPVKPWQYQSWICRACQIFGSVALSVVTLRDLIQGGSGDGGVEAGAAEHLPFDHFRFVVDAFGSPVVVRERERGGGGLDVEFEAAGEGVQVRQVGGAGVRRSTARASPRWRGRGSSMAAKDPIRLARAFISGHATTAGPRSPAGRRSGCPAW